MNNTITNRIEDGIYNGKEKSVKEFKLSNTIDINHQENNYDQNYFSSKKKIMYQNREYDIAKGSSYICQPINKDKDTVRINEVIAKDDLILCCKPRQGKYTYMKPNYTGGNIANISSKTKEERQKKSNYPYENKFYEEDKYTFKEQSNHVLRQSNHISQIPELVAPGLGTSLNLQDHVIVDHVHQPHVNSELERKIKCTRLSKRFKNYLWALFFISFIIIMIGIILLIHSLLHFLRKNYINIVIEETGFYIWVWVVMAISVFVITVGLYGIITAIDRRKRILIVYCVISSALLCTILVFLVYQWILYKHIQDVGNHSMQNTIKVYRCDRYTRDAWDNLQLTHKCCGIEDQSDWKYIPSSCCNAQTKQQKIGCLRYYIREQQAFNTGCGFKLKNYFDTFFLVAACLLALILLLLVLGMLVSLWLLEGYKKVEKCQEVYYISR